LTGDALSAAGEASPATPFGDRLAAAVARRESQVVLGLDPDPERLWPMALDASVAARSGLVSALMDADRAARAVTPEVELAARTQGRDAAAADVMGGGQRGSPTGGARADDLVAPEIMGGGRRGSSTRRARASDLTAPEVMGGERRGSSTGRGRAGELSAQPAEAGAGRRARFEAAAAVLAHCLAVIDAAGPACVAVKPQLACFERLGHGGWLALDAVCAHARRHGLLVLADGKRGDVPVTAAAYGQALLGGPGLGADAITANPLLGRDALAPLLDAARAARAGVFALVRTSNPGAADVFDLELADGRPLWERLAAAVHEAGLPGPASGLSDLGAVCGATAPAHLARMRELMPRTPFLLPGIGAQGGDVATLGPAVAPGRAAALVTASRSIVDAHATTGGDPAAAARSEAERLREAAWALR